MSRRKKEVVKLAGQYHEIKSGWEGPVWGWSGPDGKAVDLGRHRTRAERIARQKPEWRDK